MRLAPFFGMRNAGWAKVLNRILIILELSFVGGLLYMQYTEPFAGDWFYAAIILGSYLGSAVVNFVIHLVNEIIIALWYGTCEPEEIYRTISRRSEQEKARGKNTDSQSVL